MKKITLVLFITVFSHGLLFAQETIEDITPDFRHHSIYLELGGNSVLYSLNYDYSLSLSEGAKLALGAGLGLYSIDSYSDGPFPTKANLFFFTPEANILFGKNSHHFETGASLLLFQIPALRIGYRYQPRKGGFLFRAGFTPFVVGMSFIPWGGVSFGYSF